MSNYVPPIETSNDEIDAINSMTGIDWYEHFKAEIDQTSEIDVKYMNIYLWQKCNTTKRSMDIFKGYYDTAKSRLQDSIVNDRVATVGQEIAQTNFDKQISIAKTYDALYRKFEGMHTAASKLYLELYHEEFHKRKLPNKSQGKMRTMKDMTPAEIQAVQDTVNKMLK
jgi:hypothetical protein